MSKRRVYKAKRNKHTSLNSRHKSSNTDFLRAKIYRGKMIMNRPCTIKRLMIFRKEKI